MSLKNIKSNTQAQRGFTIVELLIVVVVIAILAAITIVSYNGITSRANDSAAKSAAATVQKKAELYASDGTTGTYPTTFAALTGASSSSTFYLTGISLVNPTSNAPDSSNGKNTVRYWLCGRGSATTAPANLAAITAITGARVEYYSFSAGQPAFLDLGQASGTIGVGTSPVVQYTIACYTTAT